jgi:DNA-binding CsgD family transcriptional regulator
MTWERAEEVTRAGQLAAVLSSLKNLGVTDRGLFNEIMRRVLVANPCLLGVWTVWEPNALDSRDALFAGAPGHDQNGRFVPFWHRYGGNIQLEVNTDYDKPGSEWYFAPARRRAEVLIDPYEYRVAGKDLFITSIAAPILHEGKCAGVAGFDIHMDLLFQGFDGPGVFESIETSLGRGHILLGEDGQVRYCSRATRRLLSRYVGAKPSCQHRRPESLDGLLQKLRQPCLPACFKVNRGWSFRSGSRRLVVRPTRYPHNQGILLLLDEQIDNGSSCRAAKTLSPREQEVADWVAHGKSNEEIAMILGISGHTVKNHLDKIFRKLGVENRYAAAIATHQYFPERSYAI